VIAALRTELCQSGSPLVFLATNDLPRVRIAAAVSIGLPAGLSCHWIAINEGSTTMTFQSDSPLTSFRTAEWWNGKRPPDQFQSGSPLVLFPTPDALR